MILRRRWTTIAGLVLLLLSLAIVGCQGQGNAPEAETAAETEAPENLFLMVDMVQGSKNVPEDERAQSSCVMTNRFPRNSEIVWRARVFDPATGELMGDEVLDSVQVQLANGETIDMRYGAHPRDDPNAEFYWTGSWVVPEDHATGTLNYSVVAESTDGRTGEFAPFNVQPSLLTITDRTLETIEEEQ